MTVADDYLVNVRERLYIGGEWVEPTGDEMIDVLDSTTEEVIGSAPAGSAADVDRAVRSAVAAFDGWSATPREERAEWMGKISAALSDRAEEIAHIISREVGMPEPVSALAQAAFSAMDFANTQRAVGELRWEEEVGNSIVTREPVGVVAAITPWNFPLHQICAKTAPALAAGCTIVVKPSEVAPLSAFILTEILDQLGLPAGVFNLVSGTGPVVGEALAAHPEVDAVSFTGSTKAGARVSELAGASVKRVSVELGGKSPAVVLDDAALEEAVAECMANCFLNSGQSCSALTRLLVPRSRLAQAEEAAAAAAASYVVGDPSAEGTTLGPLVSDLQRDRVLSYIRKGVEEGAKLVCGGSERPDGLDKGYFVAPTVFSEVSPEMTIAQEEIFGPVLSIIPYEGEEDAIRIANGTRYGLSGAVWGGDADHAKQVASRIRTGQVTVNGGEFNTEAPFGGFKQSGHGRELGRFGLEEFLTTRSLQL